jgi:hypothetical protein
MGFKKEIEEKIGRKIKCKDNSFSRKYLLFLAQGYRKVGLLKDVKLNQLGKFQIQKLLCQFSEEFLKKCKNMKK